MQTIAAIGHYPPIRIRESSPPRNSIGVLVVGQTPQKSLPYELPELCPVRELPTALCPLTASGNDSLNACSTEKVGSAEWLPLHNSTVAIRFKRPEYRRQAKRKAELWRKQNGGDNGRV